MYFSFNGKDSIRCNADTWIIIHFHGITLFGTQISGEDERYYILLYNLTLEQLPALSIFVSKKRHEKQEVY